MVNKKEVSRSGIHRQAFATTTSPTSITRHVASTLFGPVMAAVPDDRWPGRLADQSAAGSIINMSSIGGHPGRWWCDGK